MADAASRSSGSAARAAPSNSSYFLGVSRVDGVTAQWITGQLRGGYTDWVQPPDLSGLETNRDLLLVVDYAETRPHLIRHVIEHLYSARHCTRGLLIARAVGPPPARTQPGRRLSHPRHSDQRPLIELGPLHPGWTSHGFWVLGTFVRDGKGLTGTRRAETLLSRLGRSMLQSRALWGVCMAEKDYDDIVATAVIAAAATGPLVVAPVADLTVLSGVWTAMLAAINKRSGHGLERDFFLKVPAAVLVGGGLYRVGSKLLQRFIMAAIAATGVGAAPVMSVNGILNALATWRASQAYIELCETEDFDPLDWDRTVKILKEAVKPWPTREEIRFIINFLRWKRL
ncbi:hypothetical protein GCM10012286_80870 [Streptomyces lasiicapitis]|uniref:DUF697 domain-containing protein n=2 Tax=Streptomyces lasiicapitis TaxID=1923961 RepID=A0ABQ2MXL5_9ACTN|nr:hypothetical protein GCM10012286_80870 [Streptomyces lasiicapitis]